MEKELERERAKVLQLGMAIDYISIFESEREGRLCNLLQIEMGIDSISIFEREIRGTNDIVSIFVDESETNGKKEMHKKRNRETAKERHVEKEQRNKVTLWARIMCNRYTYRYTKAIFKSKTLRINISDALSKFLSLEFKHLHSQ